MDQDPVTVVCISDLHDAPLPPLPSGDILAIAGDLSEGLPTQLCARYNEISSIRNQFEHILVIAGNHDRALDSDCDSRDAAIHDDITRRIECRRKYRSSSVFTYLENAGTTIHCRNGRVLKVWASPASLASSRQTCFGYSTEEAQRQWDQVPDDTDLLITHGPPLGYLDGERMLGCKALSRTLWRVRPLLHVFGHVHEGRGNCILRYDDVQQEYEDEVLRLDSVAKATLSSNAGKYLAPALRTAINRKPPPFPLHMTIHSNQRPRKKEESILVNAAIQRDSEISLLQI